MSTSQSLSRDFALVVENMINYVKCRKRMTTHLKNKLLEYVDCLEIIERELMSSAFNDADSFNHNIRTSRVCGKLFESVKSILSSGIRGELLLPIFTQLVDSIKDLLLEIMEKTNNNLVKLQSQILRLNLVICGDALVEFDERMCPYCEGLFDSEAILNIHIWATHEQEAKLDRDTGMKDMTLDSNFWNGSSWDDIEAVKVVPKLSGAVSRSDGSAWDGIKAVKAVPNVSSAFSSK